MFHEIGFPHAGRPDDDDVLLRELDAIGFLGRVVTESAQVFRVVVVVADGDGERLLGLVLLDDETVEVRLDLLGKQIEIVDVRNLVLA